MTMSRHVQEDRLDRMVYIATTIGFGEVIFERVNDDRRECITDTGVFMVKSIVGDTLITAYIIGIDKATAIFRRTCGDRRMPAHLYETIRKNAKHVKLQNTAKF